MPKPLILNDMAPCHVKGAGSAFPRLSVQSCEIVVLWQKKRSRVINLLEGRLDPKLMVCLNRMNKQRTSYLLLFTAYSGLSPAPEIFHINSLDK